MNGTDDPAEFEEKVQYPDPLLKILSVLTGDNRFEALKGEFEEGGSTMSELLDKLLDKRMDTKTKDKSKEIVRKLFANGVSMDVVLDSVSDLPKDEIQEIFNSIAKKES